jgi:glutamate synthase domain-containing protein 3
MTGGVAVVLGDTGRNFGAGMSGGVAFVYDPHGTFTDRLNPQMVQLARLSGGLDESLLKAMVERHYELTESIRAGEILDDWTRRRDHFWRVVPQPGSEDTTAKPEISYEAVALEAILEELGRQKNVPELGS